jgi:hypothetical protein
LRNVVKERITEGVCERAALALRTGGRNACDRREIGMYEEREREGGRNEEKVRIDHHNVKREGRELN